MAMFTRQLQLPERSFFLFGPRGTGKTTWLRQQRPEALWFDLLRTRTFLDVSQRPDTFRQQVEAQPRGRWIVVDEVQRVPSRCTRCMRSSRSTGCLSLRAERLERAQAQAARHRLAIARFRQ